MNAKKHVYLLQGEAKYIDKFAVLRNRKTSDFFCLTYDKAKENCIFLPNSTWSEGRNRLLQEALKTKTPYQYFTFLDDDVEFTKGSWRL